MSDHLHQLKKHGWLHFYQMEDLKRDEWLPRVLVRGSGIHVWDQHGRQLIDGLSGAYCVNVGYGRQRIVDAAMKAASEIHYVSPFTAANPWAVQLADRLATLAEPVLGSDCRVFFVNSGSEANDAAIKIARAYHRRKGDLARHEVIARRHAYHGTTFGALSACGIESIRKDFGPLLPGFRHAPSTLCARCELGLKPDSCAVACADAIGDLAEKSGINLLAAVLLEPLQSGGGNIPPPNGYFQKVQEFCRQSGALLILDEVITGFGRLGCWFGAEKYSVQPDIIVCAKGLTSGYQSLGAVLVRSRIGDAFLGSDERLLFHGATFGGLPSAAAAALENIAIIKEDGLLSQCQASSVLLRDLLETHLSPLPMIASIRGDGLIFAIDLVNPDARHVALEAAKVRALNSRLCAAGLISCFWDTAANPVLEIVPPLIISRDECERIVEIILAALKQIA